MLKVLIVDDEVIVRIGLKTIIDWNAYGFEIVGEAANGSEALSIIASKKPNLIITDIKMPVMDGLELMRTVYETDKKVKFLILSSFDNFEYVKQAMKLGAEDYLIKLNIQQEVLIEILDAISYKIRSENTLQDITKHKNKYISDNINVLKQDIIRKLIVGECTEILDLTETVKYLDIKWSEAGNICVVIKVLNFIESKSAEDDSFIKMFSSSLMGIANEIISEEFNAYTINLQTDEVVSIISFGEDNEVVKSAVEVVGQMYEGMYGGMM